MQRAYLAEATVSIARDGDNNSLSMVASQLGGVGSLLGLGAIAGTNVNDSLATLRSRMLVTEFLQQEDRLSSVIELLNSSRLRRLSSTEQLQVAADYFRDYILSVSYDARTSLITVTITWVDRSVAATWANAFIAFANEMMRRREIADARLRKSFLESAANGASTIDLRQSIYRLLEAQVKSEMLAATKPDFAFRIVDPAVPPQADRPVRPRSALMALAAGLLGALLAISGLLIHDRFAAQYKRN
jgi:uncharacterized protein involved in exopolysaccharide biosynthesis